MVGAKQMRIKWIVGSCWLMLNVSQQVVSQANLCFCMLLPTLSCTPASCALGCMGGWPN